MAVEIMNYNIVNINSKNENYINKNGTVYTPNFIVKKMLDFISYKSVDILKKHVIDNSCGEGAFLIEIVRRYIVTAKNNNYNTFKIVKDLENFIHGIEIDYNAHEICINNLNNLLNEFGIKEIVKWDIIRGDTLQIEKFNKKMDYVIGNPPYIRIHNLTFDYRKYSFASEGMSDLYLIFFELSIKMLNDLGEIIFITPNSFFTSKAAKKFRKHLIDNNLLRAIVDLGHFNPFKNINTYTAITWISNKKSLKKVDYYEYNLKQSKSLKFINSLKKDNFFINNSFYFSEINKLNKFKKIVSINKNPYIKVKNGISTNLDSVFYNDNYKGKFINKALKISKLKETNVFFPYDKNGKLIKLDEIEKQNFKMYKILINNMNNLKSRSLQNQQWYEFARTQGINDVYKEKMVINNIIKNVETVKTKIISSGIIPYSGYYLLSEKYDYKFIEKLIKNIDFIEYLKILRKNKNGDYYFFSSSDLHIYISYKILQSKVNV